MSTKYNQEFKCLPIYFLGVIMIKMGNVSQVFPNYSAMIRKLNGDLKAS